MRISDWSSDVCSSDLLSDTDGDGKADTRKTIVSGFGTGDTHHLIHTFRWGPEGRLYFNQSIYIYSHVETPWGVKRLEGGGVWKLQPHTLELDVYADRKSTRLNSSH